MSILVRRHLVLLAAAWFAVTAGSAWAQAATAAGRFLSVVGDVKVVAADGSRRSAAQGGEFREGETIVTGPNALAQLRTADGGLVSVRADTEMKLDKFAFAGENDKNAGFLVSLVKGGFRTITGLIGRANRDGYKVATPSATIGIRGTHYELVHVLPQAGTPQAPAGTYNRVYDGITTIQNKGGVLLLVNREQTAFVSLPGNVPPVLVTPPPALFGKPTPVPRLTPQSSSGGGTQSTGGGDKTQPATGATASQPATLVRPTTTLTPIDSTTTLRSTTTLTPIDSTTSTTVKSPTTSTLTAPTTTLTPIDSTTTTTIRSTTTLSPTTTISPTTTTISPTTTTSPIIAPTTTTTTISPTTTTIQPSTSTILLSPTTTITK